MSETQSEVAPVVDAAPAPVETAPAFTPHTDMPSALEIVAEPAPEPAPAETAEGTETTETPAVEKPADPAPQAEEAPAEAEVKLTEPPPEPSAPEPVYEFKLPEGVDGDPARIEAYTGILKENGVSPEVGQKLLDLHAEQIKSFTENSMAGWHKAFADTRKAWLDEVRSDPELGGSGFETSKKAVARARDLLVPEGDREHFNQFLQITGAGEHPALWRMLYRAARLFDEPPAPPPNLTPPPNPVPQRQGLGSIFNHPSSIAARSR